MNIMSMTARINTPYSSTRNNRTVTQPNFRGVLNEKSADHVLDMLKSKVSDIRVLKGIPEMKEIIDSLLKKHATSSNPSIGMMVIPDEKLAGMISSKSGSFNIRDYKGVCVASGDKYGPIETWNEVYESIVVLLPKNVFSQLH